MSYLAIIQARLGSVRLPNKVLLQINGETIIESVIKRVKRSTRINQIVVATGDADENLELVKHVETLGYNCFVGSETDVLGRYLDCARHYDAQHILRITADCPLVDAKIIDELIDLYESVGADYGSNTLPPTFPDGLDVEVFSIETLRRCEQNVDLKSDREHVTSYIRRNFKNTVNLANRTDYSNIRLTLDEETDFTLLNSLAENQLPLSECNWLDFVEKIETGEYVNTNLHIPRNEGKAMSNGKNFIKEQSL